ncbi:MAG: hypothetical protein AAGA48_36005 [Myxococcota bacterium]
MQIDLYQLTSLVPLHAAGRSGDEVVLHVFSRRLPQGPEGKPIRRALVFAGLARCLEHLERARFSRDALADLGAHPQLGPALAAHPDLVERLANWRFQGHIRAPREGTPLFANPAVRMDGEPFTIEGVHPAAYAPYLEITTDLLSAKLIETPLLSILNAMTMVASKAYEVVAAARSLDSDRAVLEFGSRRTHPDAAVDAAVAAYIGGCTATSNVEAHVRYGVPISGTMDHFAIQASEQADQSRGATEQAYFRAFHKLYPSNDVLLVDTYDTFGASTGIRAAVAATDGQGPWGIRIDSQLSTETLVRARRLLDELGATQTRIVISGGLDEHRIRELRDAPVDGYGIGERIVQSPDAPVGVGAVAKLAEVAGRVTMKLSRGSAKASLPGRIQVWRTPRGDVVGQADESLEGQPLLDTVWTREAGRLPLPSLAETREHALSSLSTLEPGRAPVVRVSDTLAAQVERLVKRASG